MEPLAFQLLHFMETQKGKEGMTAKQAIAQTMRCNGWDLENLHHLLPYIVYLFIL